MVNLSQAWAEAYKKGHPGVDFQVKGGGSGVGIASLIGGSIDLAHLGNCNTGGGGVYGSSARCGGNEPALRGEARFRARF